MDSMFIFGQIVAVVALCSGAVLSVFAARSVALQDAGSRRGSE